MKGSKVTGDFDESISGTVNIKYANGARYKGLVVNGCPHGQGTYVYSCGQKFEGIFNEGKREKGRLFTGSGLIYEGDWLDNNLQGQGKIYFVDGSIYEGAVKESKANGYGILRKNDEESKGYWVDNVLGGEQEDHVFSREQESDGKEIKDDRCTETISDSIGDCEIFAENGNKYQGEAKKGIPHGAGTIVDSDGRVVAKGAFDSGFIVSGLFVQDEFIYAGEFKNLVYHGQGILVSLIDYGGRKILSDFSRGEWVNGELRKGSRYQSGNIYQDGKFVNRNLYGYGFQVVPKENIEFSEDMILADNYIYDLSDETQKKLEKYAKYIRRLVIQFHKYIYEGYIKHQQYYGYGVFVDTLAPFKYIGHFRKHKFHGKGNFFTEKMYYCGDYFNGQKSGFGYRIKSNELNLSKQMVIGIKNKIEGYLEQLDSLPERLESICDLNELEYFHDYLFQDYNIYIGEYDNDSITGIGVYIADKIYKGEWLEMQRNGFGEEICTDCLIKGEWRKDSKKITAQESFNGGQFSNVYVGEGVNYSSSFSSDLGVIRSGMVKEQEVEIAYMVEGGNKNFVAHYKTHVVKYQINNTTVTISVFIYGDSGTVIKYTYDTLFIEKLVTESEAFETIRSRVAKDTLSRLRVMNL